ncbi:MAG TPA: cell envelope integrity protein CreD [Puia sp.]|nr:cell envelope integrity protein CreD [Puia sp.]
MTNIRLAARICFLSSIALDAGLLICMLIMNPLGWYFFIPAFIALLIGSLPVAVALSIFLPAIKRMADGYNNKIYLTILLCGVCALTYGLIAFFIVVSATALSGHWSPEGIRVGLGTFAFLFCASSIALFLSKNQLADYFGYSNNALVNYKQTNMETSSNAGSIASSTNRSNKILIKGAITAALIGLMMIPTIFISDLVRERQDRNATVVKEVASRWAQAQTLSGPYIYLPYKTYSTDASGKPVVLSEHLFIIPENKEVTGKIGHETRKRSIYKVLLYRAALSDQGNFAFTLPKEVNAGQVQWADARICFGISDFKGIEEKITVHFNGQDLELSPGLPDGNGDAKGLSAPITLTAGDLGKPLNYAMNVKIKGSEMLHFVPLSGNGHYALSSDWPNPSFDGNNLPSERTVTKTGFTASWNFNKANLPFGIVFNDFKFDPATLAFGVTMVEPADQYAKTDRSIKYAILIIGLTFSLFFIIELMQRKPIHPVQYVLIGLALVIFYSLLLAISEFLDFDYAYGIASAATILLICFYARAHFRSWRSAGIFSGVLTLLYGFIFVLIRLEDTALLVGSIGLFIILALTMYGSKKVNWYGTPDSPELQ